MAVNMGAAAYLKTLNFSARIPSCRIDSSFVALLVFLHCLLSAATWIHSAAASVPPSYSAECSSIVPESSALGDLIANVSGNLHFDTGYFTGADEFLGEPSGSTVIVGKSMNFMARTARLTDLPGIFKVDAELRFSGPRFSGDRSFNRPRLGGRSLLRHRVVSLRQQRGSLRLQLSGFWSESTGKLCMVGTGQAKPSKSTVVDVSVVFKFNYPKASNISTTLATGTVKSLDAAHSSSYFSPISLVAYTLQDYQYTLEAVVESLNTSLDASSETLGMNGDKQICLLVRSMASRQNFKLDYTKNCQGKRCGPFSGKLGLLPGYVALRGIQCSTGGRLHLYMIFSNFSYGSPTGHMDLEPGITLLGEGIWDNTSNHLTLMACQVSNFTVSPIISVARDCVVGVRLWFPKFMSIMNRSFVVGRIWSTKSKTDAEYFDSISFQDSGHYWGVTPDVKYKFTKTETVKKFCSFNNTADSGGKVYPSMSSLRDLSYNMHTKSPDGGFIWGSVTPRSIDEVIYEKMMIGQSLPSAMKLKMNHTIWNISYLITFNRPVWDSSMKNLIDISAEGIYNVKTGHLCLVGCGYVLPFHDKDKKNNLRPLDCEIMVNIQLPPVNSKQEMHTTGAIKSLRRESDPLYFKEIEISSVSMYTSQAVETLSRMDLEIAMVLISITVSCAFILVQLSYVKKNQDVLPSISLTMLVILTLGYMIPLLLNFKAMFSMERNKQNVLLWSGRWLEAKEIIARVVMMVAFLLQFRLLQLTWNARIADDRKKELWIAERKTLQFCLPLYFFGILFSWYLNSRSHQTRAVVELHSVPHASLWDDILSFAGLVRDGFLLPQIILSIFSNSKVKSLSPAYYIGITTVRAVPHLYDFYRAHHYVPYRYSYIYAAPGGDFYSNSWDIVIPCVGFLFAVIIYLQQRFSGTCIVPKRFRKPSGYESVSVTNG